MSVETNYTEEKAMNTQINALKQACRAFYEREHRAGITTDELVAFKACKAAVQAVTGEYYASGEWHVTCFDNATLLEVAK